MLQALVDQGILLALSTTIVGGIGGYLMRIAKLLRLGPLLDAFYTRLNSEHSDAVLARLEAIERAVLDLAPQDSPGRAGANLMLPAIVHSGHWQPPSALDDERSLETDVMRFMALLGFCLMAVFALIQSHSAEPAGGRGRRAQRGAGAKTAGDAAGAARRP